MLWWIVAVASVLSSAVAVRTRPILQLSVADPGRLIRRHSAKKNLAEVRTYTREQLTQAPVCGSSPPVLMNSSWAYSSLDGSVITYLCDVGFRTTSGDISFDYTCTKNQPLPLLSDSCSLVSCPAPAPIANGNLQWPFDSSVRYGGFGSTVNIQCDIGYSGDGQAKGPNVVQMQCADSGDYEFVLPTITSCELIHCSPPVMISHGNITNNVDPFSVVPYNTVVEYECALGYSSLLDISQSSFALTCGPAGEFLPNDPFPLCIPQKCPSPPVLPFAQTVHAAGIVDVNSRVVYQCDPGFVMSNNPAVSSFSVRCDFVDNRPKYVIPDAVCQSAPCNAVPDVPFANVNDNGISTVWRYRDVVPFSCVPGYTVGGVRGMDEFTGGCNQLGIWSIDNEPGCSPVQCAQVPGDITGPALEYGYMMPFDTYPVLFQANTTIVCSAGALVTGTNGTATSFTLECAEDGYFSNNGVCAIPCPVIPKVPFSTSTAFGSSIEYGQPGQTITCKPGYRTPSGLVQQTVVCNRDGTLSNMEECNPWPGAGPETDWAYQPTDYSATLKDLVQSGILASETRKSASTLLQPFGYVYVAVLLGMLLFPIV